MCSPTLWLGKAHHLVVFMKRRERVKKEEKVGAMCLQGLARALWLNRWTWNSKLQGGFNRISDHDALRGLNAADDSAYPSLDLDLVLALLTREKGRGRGMMLMLVVD